MVVKRLTSKIALVPVAFVAVLAFAPREALESLEARRPQALPFSACRHPLIVIA